MAKKSEIISIEIQGWSERQKESKVGQWIRLDCDHMNNHKIAQLSDSQYRLYFTLLCLAGAQRRGGRVSILTSTLRSLSQIRGRSTQTQLAKLSELELIFSQQTDKQTDKPTKEIVPVFKLPEDVLEEAYRRYPRKEGKKKGFEKIHKVIKSELDLRRFCIAVANYAKKCDQEKTEKCFIKHFSSFVSVWEDYETIELKPEKKRRPIPEFKPENLIR